MVLLVREQDKAWLGGILEDQWNRLVHREGRRGEDMQLAEGEFPACPACGTAAALVAGACSDCGLQLA